MPITRPSLTRPLPRAVVRRQRRPVQTSGGAGAPLSLILGGWNYLARVWISFDPPNMPLPMWIEITNFVETESAITITHGRADGIGDVNTTTCQMTIDNSDGRFCPDNPSGAWFGLIDLGCWLKVDVLAPSGNVYDRFVGFTNNLPTGWQGQYASSMITAADRYEKLGQAPPIPSMIQAELMTDPNLRGNVKGYWNLQEPQGTLTFGDTSGQGARHLQAGAVGLPANSGIGIGTGAANGPGFDGQRAVTFNPVATNQGSYLTAPIAVPAAAWSAGPSYSGLTGVLSFWYKAANTGLQTLAAIVDPIAQYAITVYQDTDATLWASYVQTRRGGSAAGAVGTTPTIGTIGDGKWHHIAVAMAATNQLGGAYSVTLFLDGQNVQSGAQTGIAGANGNFTQLIIGGGYNFYTPGTLQVGAGNISNVAWYWADASGLGNLAKVPNFPAHYAAGNTGFVGESTDARIARIARYANIPINTISVRNFLFTGMIPIYAPGLGPWTNLSAGTHLVGTQSMAGRKPLDVMQEAAHTELMPLFINRSGYLTLQPSTLRQNTTPAWTVDARDLDPSTGLAKDFAYTTNQASITPNGLAAQTVIGPYGAASQARYGVYAQGGSLATANVNPVEAQSLGYAVVQQRAKPLSRLAPLVVEVATLATQAGYGTAWYDAVLASEISTPVRVTNTPPQMGGGTSDVFIEGWTETLSPGNHTFAFSTSPIQGPTYQLDDAVLGRLDTDGSTLAGAVTSGATTLPVTVTGIASGSAVWTPNGADVPFDVNVGGEQVTVTAITSASSLGAVDGTFESGVAGWSLGAGTVLTSSTGAANTGTKSGLASSSTTLVQITSPDIAVTPGLTYTLTMWMALKAGAIDQAAVRITWSDAGHVLLSLIDSSPLATATGSWTSLTVSQVAPAGAAFAQVQFHGRTLGSDTIYIDDASFLPQLFTVVRSVNGVVAAHAAGTDVQLWTPLTLAY